MSYTVRDVVENIKIALSTVHDLTGKSNNNLFSNFFVCRYLRYALDKFCSHTLAIEDVASYAVDNNTYLLPLPKNCLRTKTFRFVYALVGKRYYPMNIQYPNNALPVYNFTPISGIPSSVMPWGGNFFILPKFSEGAKSAVLASAITDTATTLTLTGAQVDAMQTHNGILTIEDEKVFYAFRSGNTFNGLVRGYQSTTAASHSSGVNVYEDNLIAYYYRLHFSIRADENDVIDSETLERGMEISDEHVENIVNYCVYKLLSKIDPERAKPYEIDYDKYIEEARYRIEQGRNDYKKVSAIRPPFYAETDNMYGYSGVL